MICGLFLYLSDMIIRSLYLGLFALLSFLQQVVLPPPGKQQLYADSLVVAAAGDIMLGTDYPSSRYLPPGGCSGLLTEVKPILLEADLAFCNLEGTFSSSGGQAKKCRDTTRCYVFRMPDEYVNCLVEAGFDLVSTANNHCNDFGAGGRQSTMRVLDEAGLYHAGMLEKPAVIFEKDGRNIGFCAFAPFRGSADMKNSELLRQTIMQLDAESSLVIVALHAGAEGKEHQHVTREDEIYLGYNRGNVYQVAHEAIDAGADLVLAHGPHVTRAVELYKDRLICYSLGNFCTYARFNLRGPNGIAPLISIVTGPGGKFIEARVTSIKQAGSGIPVPDPEERAYKKLKELTLQDFPETSLSFPGDGSIIRK